MLVDANGRWTLPELASAYEVTRKLIAPQQPLWLSEASRRFIEAVCDFPDSTPLIYSRVNRHGRRWNPASLLERGEGKSPKVEVVRAAVDQVVWDKDRAVGVRVLQGDSSSQLSSSHGVVLCAGTLATPSILMRSGIGPRDALGCHKIDVRCEHASVGKNLQDHLIMPVIFETKSTNVFTLNASVRDTARWQAVGAGPIGSNIAESGGLFHRGKVQIHITPTNYLTFPQESDASVMTVGVNLTQPRSRGTVTVASKDLQIPPCIDPNYLADESDLEGTIRAVQLARRIAFDTCIAEWITREALPGPKRASDTSIAKSIARYAQTLYHPVGTCRMGCQTDSVVDSKFELRGSEGIWIADASVLPQLTQGNPNATIMMLATLAADSVKRQLETQD
jgi:choline dehydrogenase-like flavoprotein